MHLRDSIEHTIDQVVCVDDVEIFLRHSDVDLEQGKGKILLRYYSYIHRRQYEKSNHYEGVKSEKTNLYRASDRHV